MKTRVISGAVLAVIAILALSLGGWFLFGICAIISLIGMYELYRVSGIEKSSVAVAGYITAGIYYLSIALNISDYDIFIFVLGFMVIMTIYVFTFPKYKSEQVIMAFVGIFYVALMLSYIYRVRIAADGIYIVWLIFVCSWGNDTFAYFTGVLFGKHKMTSKLSPKKTVEGAIGGVAGATVLGAVYGAIISPYMSGIVTQPVLVFAIASFIGAFLAIVGDLTASAIKRNYNIKDYGNLIPGHGGILDRFDSVIFTAPAVYWAVYIITKFL